MSHPNTDLEKTVKSQPGQQQSHDPSMNVGGAMKILRENTNVG